MLLRLCEVASLTIVYASGAMLHPQGFLIGGILLVLFSVGLRWRFPFNENDHWIEFGILNVICIEPLFDLGDHISAAVMNFVKSVLFGVLVILFFNSDTPVHNKAIVGTMLGLIFGLLYWIYLK